MFVGILRLDLYMAQSRSLKNKRSLLQSLKGRISNKFNVAVAEVGETLDLWQRGELGLVTVSNDQRVIHSVFDQVVGLVEASPGVTILHRELRFV